MELLTSIFKSRKISNYTITSITKDELNRYYLDLNLISNPNKNSNSYYNAEFSHLYLRINRTAQVSLDGGILYVGQTGDYWFDNTEEVQDINCFAAYVYNIIHNKLI